jgi:hypothetical protein
MDPQDQARGQSRPTSHDAKPDPVTCNLDVYDAREGEDGDAWNKDCGLLFIPDNWGYLPRGDAFLTRTVKRLGPTWVRKKNDRRRRITKTLGLYAPLANIRAAEAMAEQTHATAK